MAASLAILITQELRVNTLELTVNTQELTVNTQELTVTCAGDSVAHVPPRFDANGDVADVSWRTDSLAVWRRGQPHTV